MLINGKGDELMNKRQAFQTGGLSFSALKKCSLINEAAHAANDAPDFSTRIRAALP